MFQVCSKEIEYFWFYLFYQNGYHFECHNVPSSIFCQGISGGKAYIIILDVSLFWCSIKCFSDFFSRVVHKRNNVILTKSPKFHELCNFFKYIS